MEERHKSIPDEGDKSFISGSSRVKTEQKTVYRFVVGELYYPIVPQRFPSSWVTHFA